MKKIIRLTESDLTRIVRRTINEMEDEDFMRGADKNWDDHEEEEEEEEDFSDFDNTMYDGGRTHDLLNHNQVLYQLSYIHHVSPVYWCRTNLKSDMSQLCSPRTYGLNAEDIGIEPNPEGTSRLAGGPHPHQGLSSKERSGTAVPQGSYASYSSLSAQ